MIPQDNLQREQALNPNQSFIVQAPAGSGKTELLVQRFLVLLSQAEKNPEEILAITFTRKAASEMRHRIIQALNLASHPLSTEDSYQRKTWELAQKVLNKNEKLQWNLLENPNRLRIQTIDSFCQYLTAQMPLLSRLGMQPQILEDPSVCYLEAAKEVLKSLEENVTWSSALSHLLLHVDNQQEQLVNLLVDMLKRRDQWLSYVLTHQTSAEYLIKLRELLEESLQHILIENLENCYAHFPFDYSQEFIQLIRYAAEQLKEIFTPDINPILYCAELTQIPPPTLDNHLQWLGILQFLLTKQFQWRRQIDKNLGFPRNSNMKPTMLNFIENISCHENFRQSLENLAQSPPCFYSQTQWTTLEALLEILPILAAQLKLVFAKRGVCDFSEISLAALNALDDDPPTDIALYLDYKIRHILIDEFQDTSITQFKLLEKLTAHWQKEDGRTLFLVGDPMQSIYRFREAEVGLFLKAQQEGIGSIELNNLCLQVNFRSTSQIVNWINQQFQSIFPQEADIASGAVTYTPSIPVLKNENSSVKIVNFNENESYQEAQHIVSIIHNTRQKDQQASIGILVRSRSHLFQIISVLTQNKISFSAVEIEALAQKAIVHDLIALSRALFHLADRIAWLAVLRAPWCGLKLTDLHAIASVDPSLPLWHFLKTYHEIANLSQDARQRLNRIIPVLADSLANRQRQSLRIWIENTWLALGGPACVKQLDEINDADIFFDLFEKFNEEDLIQPGYLEEKVNALYTSPKNSGEPKIQIMTIHKAKGLEFDTVILPSLERKAPSDPNQLLMWLNRPRKKGENDLILAPIKSKNEETDLIYKYLRSVEKKKKQFETARLVYVAATRAKKHLYLLTKINFSESSPSPSTDSFLGLLWPKLKSEFTVMTENTEANQNETTETLVIPPLRRLISNWQLPSSVSFIQPLQEHIQKSHYEFKNNDHLMRIIGLLIHQTLQKVAQDGVSQWNESKIFSQYQYWKNVLLKQSISQQELPRHLEIIHSAIRQTLKDARGQWILDSSHLESETEYPITTLVNHEIKHFVLDRTFVDRQTDIRWIIDYKTSILTDCDQTKIMEQYKIQLHQYAQAMQHIEKREIRTGLYFPLSSHWHEIGIFKK